MPLSRFILLILSVMLCAAVTLWGLTLLPPVAVAPVMPALLILSLLLRKLRS